jgi:hypothetical protein
MNENKVASFFSPQPPAVLTWFDLQNVVGALVAALPIAIALTVLIRDHYYGVALLVAETVAGTVLLSGYIHYPPRQDNASAWWMVAIVQFVALHGSPLVLVWLCRSTPSNMRWSGRGARLRWTREQADD